MMSSNDRRRVLTTMLNDNRLGGEYSGTDTLNSFIYDNQDINNANLISRRNNNNGILNESNYQSRLANTNVNNSMRYHYNNKDLNLKNGNQ